MLGVIVYYTFALNTLNMFFAYCISITIILQHSGMLCSKCNYCNKTLYNFELYNRFSISVRGSWVIYRMSTLYICMDERQYICENSIFHLCIKLDKEYNCFISHIQQYGIVRSKTCKKGIRINLPSLPNTRGAFNS